MVLQFFCTVGRYLLRLEFAAETNSREDSRVQALLEVNMLLRLGTEVQVNLLSSFAIPVTTFMVWLYIDIESVSLVRKLACFRSFVANE